VSERYHGYVGWSIRCKTIRVPSQKNTQPCESSHRIGVTIAMSSGKIFGHIWCKHFAAAAFRGACIGVNYCGGRRAVVNLMD